MRYRPVYDVVALLARCGVGAVFLVHGWQKIQVGVTATGRTFGAMGVPAPTAAAVYATFAELLGGAALILGVLLPVAGTLLFLDMAGAFAFVNARHGLLLVDQGRVKNGFELVLVLGLAALLFAAGGGGRITLDRRLFGRRGGRQDDHDPDWPDNWLAPPSTTEVPPARTGRGSSAPSGPGGDSPVTGSAKEGSASGRQRGTGAAGSGSPGTRPAGAAGPKDDARDTGATGGTGSGDDAGGSFDDLSGTSATTPVRRARTGHGTAGTSRDVPVAGRRTPATDDAPSGRTRKSRKDS